MSPDPSVHEDQLRSIERERSRKPKKRGCGSGLFTLLFLAVAVVAAFVLRDKWTPFLRRDTYQSLRDKGEALRRTPPRDILRDLRAKTASLQDDWKNLNESGELRKRLESLRDDLAARRDEAGELVRNEWEEAVQKSEELLAKARAQKEKLPPLELGELRKKLERLEERLTGSKEAGKPAEKEGAQPEPDKKEADKPAQ